MMVHGSWSYGIQATQGGDFVKNGGLGYMNFPPVEGGKGDPTNQVGNPGHYLSIASNATPEAKEVGKKFLATLVDDKEPGEWIKTGNVPIIKQRRPVRRPAERRVPQVRLRPLDQRQGVRPVLGPGAEPDRGGDAAGQHRQAFSRDRSARSSGSTT